MARKFTIEYTALGAFNGATPVTSLDLAEIGKSIHADPDGVFRFTVPSIGIVAPLASSGSYSGVFVTNMWVEAPGEITMPVDLVDLTSEMLAVGVEQEQVTRAVQQRSFFYDQAIYIPQGSALRLGPASTIGPSPTGERRLRFTLVVPESTEEMIALLNGVSTVPGGGGQWAAYVLIDETTELVPVNALPQDADHILVDVSDGSRSLSLPSARLMCRRVQGGRVLGKKYIIECDADGAAAELVLTRVGTDTINGQAADFTVPSGRTVIAQSNGVSGWRVIEMCCGDGGGDSPPS